MYTHPVRSLLLAACAALATSALAAGRPGVQDQLVDLFTRYDANHDHSLSAGEQAKALAFVRARHGALWERTARLLFGRAASGQAIAEDAWLRQVQWYGPRNAPLSDTARIRMNDGANLATDIYLPEGPGPFPVVLSRTPYGRATHFDSAERMTHEGIAFVVQDVRGRFDSEGENLPFVGCGWEKHQDGAETVAWLLRQPWCNGKVGTWGGSAGGITQNLLAGAAPAGLKAQYIVVAAASLYAHAAYVGGASRKCQIEGWTRHNHYDDSALTLMLTHPCYDDYWRGLDSTLKFPVMNVPALHVGGWFDTFAQGTIDSFVGRQTRGAEGSRGRQKLVMGPWAHAGWRKEGTGELVFPNSRLPDRYEAVPWFTHYLKGSANGAADTPAVAYYVMGDTSSSRAPGNEWRYADAWPIPATDTPWHFHADGTLAPAKPAAEAQVRTYTFNPADPCPTIGGGNLNIPAGPRNQNPIEARKDVLLFTSQPLTSPIEVTGRVKARIFVSSSAPDTDLSVRLCDVYPDGKSYLMAEGMLRLRYRHSFEKPEPLTPGRIEEVEVDCWSTSIVFNRGHRIRATVTSSNYPRFDLNPGTGQPWSDTGPKLSQTNSLYCDPQHPSSILLPIVSAPPR